MGIEFKSITSFNVPVTIKDGTGQQIAKLTVIRKGVSFDEWESLQARQKQYSDTGDDKSLQDTKNLLAEDLAQIVTGWDVTEGGKPVEVTGAVLAALDAGILIQLHDQVLEHCNPNPVKPASE